jgi:hypothetical protein
MAAVDASALCNNIATSAMIKPVRHQVAANKEESCMLDLPEAGVPPTSLSRFPGMATVKGKEIMNNTVEDDFEDMPEPETETDPLDSAHNAPTSQRHNTPYMPTMLHSLAYGAQTQQRAPWKSGAAVDSVKGNMAANSVMQLAINALAATGNVCSQPLGWSDIFTVMMRNLPNKVTQDLLIAEVEASGFADTYDFMYLPVDPETNANRGYAFINFRTPGFALMFKIHFEGRKFSNFNSHKVVSVVPAALQGFDANYANYSNSYALTAQPLFLRKPKPNAKPLSLQEPKPPGKAKSQRIRKKTQSLIDVAAEQQAAKQHETQQAELAARQKTRRSGATTTNKISTQDVVEVSTEDTLPEAFSRADDELPTADGELPVEGAKQQGPLRFCPYCGGRILLSYKFCQFCGAGLSFPKAGMK